MALGHHLASYSTFGAFARVRRLSWPLTSSLTAARKSVRLLRLSARCLPGQHFRQTSEPEKAQHEIILRHGFADIDIFMIEALGIQRSRVVRSSKQWFCRIGPAPTQHRPGKFFLN